MQRKIIILFLIFGFFLVFMESSYAESANSIVVAAGKCNDYYHVKVTLTPENSELTVSFDERPQTTPYIDNKYEFSSWGQFEVFVDRNVFPVPAPHFTKKYLILRMPGTKPGSEKAKKYIEEKRRLFEEIKNMKLSGKGQVEVIVELNPYINVLSKDPLRVELSGRNIFFRDAHGRYIDYLGPLKEE